MKSPLSVSVTGCVRFLISGETKLNLVKNLCRGKVSRDIREGSGVNVTLSRKGRWDRRKRVEECPRQDLSCRVF